MQSKNSIIKYIFLSALDEDSRLGNNFRRILYMNGMTTNDFRHMNIDSEELCNLILMKWNNSLEEASIKTGEHILELISRRDSLDPWILSKAEIQDVIQMISTS